MITLSPDTPPGQPIAELIEQLADPVGSAERAARLDAAISDASDLIERATKALAGIDMVRELTDCQSKLKRLSDDAKSNAAVAKQLNVQLMKRLEAIKGL